MLDASITISLLLEKEVEPDTTALVADIHGSYAIVPQLWHSEIRNALLIAEHRGRISREQIASRLLYRDTLAIRTDGLPNFDDAMALARDYNLTYYGVLYLELGWRRSIRLWRGPRRMKG